MRAGGSPGAGFQPWWPRDPHGAGSVVPSSVPPGVIPTSPRPQPDTRLPQQGTVTRDAVPGLWHRPQILGHRRDTEHVPQQGGRTERSWFAAPPPSSLFHLQKASSRSWGTPGGLGRGSGGAAPLTRARGPQHGDTEWQRCAGERRARVRAGARCCAPSPCLLLPGSWGCAGGTRGCAGGTSTAAARPPPPCHLRVAAGLRGGNLELGYSRY